MWLLLGSFKAYTALVGSRLSYTHFMLDEWMTCLGQSTALQWWSAGCRTLDDLREGKGGVKLTSVQEIGLLYYDGDLSSSKLKNFNSVTRY
jgi:hypothetical protein